MWHYVYILRNAKGKQYVGHTDNLEDRLKEHNEGSVPATKRDRPWIIEWFCAFRDMKKTIAWEKHLKTGSGTAIRYKHFVPKTLSCTPRISYTAYGTNTPSMECKVGVP